MSLYLMYSVATNFIYCRNRQIVADVTVFCFRLLPPFRDSSATPRVKS
jgi:hypothetical protein